MTFLYHYHTFFKEHSIKAAQIVHQTLVYLTVHLLDNATAHFTLPVKATAHHDDAGALLFGSTLSLHMF